METQVVLPGDRNVVETGLQREEMIILGHLLLRLETQPSLATDTEKGDEGRLSQGKVRVDRAADRSIV